MKREIEIEKLIVNPENYRFDPVDTQDQAISVMLEEKGDEIFNLARHILEKGMDRAKDSRVLKKTDDQYLVLDGNRRTTAVKCLLNPSLVKNLDLRKRFIVLLEGGKKAPVKINCLVYESEAEAAEWIKLDHTGKNAGVGQDSWGPAEQDRFDYKFGGKKSPATQLVDLFVEKTGKTLRTKDLKISTVNRLLSNPESRSYLGVDIVRGQTKLLSEEQEVVSRLGKLFTKIIKDDVPVAQVYKTPQAVNFMRELYGNKPKVLTVPGTTQPKNGSSPSTGKKALPKSSSRTRLIPKECVLTIKESKINNIYRELRDDLILDNTPAATPNAVAVLFRVFLEVSLDHYLAKRCGITLPQDATINQKIDAVANFMLKNKIATARQLSTVRTVSSGKKTDILHILRFHEYVHSTTIQPDPSGLKAKWDNLQEFFQILWDDFEAKIASARTRKT